MKTIVEINTCDYGSTGRIMLQLSNTIQKNGDRCYIVVPNGRHNPWNNKKGYIKFGNRFSEDFHILLGRLTGLQGCFSFFSTLKLVKELNNLKPDIIHLHNLHNSYINLPLLFKYLKKERVRTVWTLHDCWAFTGHCPHFMFEECNKWKTGCYNCPSFRNYPKSFFDNSKVMYRLKRKWFKGVYNLTIVTPSEWLAGLVKQSFLNEYSVKVINNGIDLSVFKPTSKTRKNNEQFIVLGVAFDWGIKKGLDVFIELSKRLNPEKYKIILVGTDSTIDKMLPATIESIHRTDSQMELAELYSSADVFVNPTREDNYPTVNMEAIACGTPVITFRTGGSAEMLTENTGVVIDCGDIDSLCSEIIRVCSKKMFSKDIFLKESQKFDYREKMQEYCRLYNDILR